MIRNMEIQNYVVIKMTTIILLYKTGYHNMSKQLEMMPEQHRNDVETVQKLFLHRLKRRHNTQKRWQNT